MLTAEKYRVATEDILGELSSDDEILDAALELFEQFYEPAYASSRPAEITAKAIYLLAARQQGNLLRASELADDNSEKNQIIRCKQSIAEKLDLTTTPLVPEELLPVFADKLHLSDEIESHAQVLLEKADYPSRAPATIAASVLYAAAFLNDEPITQEEIRDKVGVSQPAVRGTYREFVGIE